MSLCVVFFFFGGCVCVVALFKLLQVTELMLMLISNVEDLLTFLKLAEQECCWTKWSVEIDMKILRTQNIESKVTYTAWRKVIIQDWDYLLVEVKWKSSPLFLETRFPTKFTLPKFIHFNMLMVPKLRGAYMTVCWNALSTAQMKGHFLKTPLEQCYCELVIWLS